MAYSNVWSDSIPAGSAAANTIDEHIKQLRLDIHERMDDLVESWTADPIVPQVSVTRAVKVSRAAALNIVNSISVFTSISWDTEAFDTDTMHDNSSNPTRLLIPAGLTGTRHVRVYGSIAIANEFDNTMVTVRIKKNGTEIARFVNRQTEGSSFPQCTAVYTEDRGISGDYYELEALQASGVDKALNTDEKLTYFGLSVQ